MVSFNTTGLIWEHVRGWGVPETTSITPEGVDEFDDVPGVDWTGVNGEEEAAGGVSTTLNFPEGFGVFGWLCDDTGVDGPAVIFNDGIETIDILSEDWQLVSAFVFVAVLLSFLTGGEHTDTTLSSECSSSKTSRNSSSKTSWSSSSFSIKI